MMKVSRETPIYVFPYIDFSFQTPKASATLLSSSARSGKLSVYFFANFALLALSRIDAPRTTTPRSVNALLLSRKPHACFEHPGVSSLGYQYKTTYLPL